MFGYGFVEIGDLMKFHVPACGVQIEEAGTNFAPTLRPAMKMAEGPFGISEGQIAANPNLARTLRAIETSEGRVPYRDAMLVANNAQDGWGPMLMDAIGKTPRDVHVRITGHPIVYDMLGTQVDLNGYSFALRGMTGPERRRMAGVVDEPPEQLTLVGRFNDAIKVSPGVISTALQAERKYFVLSKVNDEIKGIEKTSLNPIPDNEGPNVIALYEAVEPQRKEQTPAKLEELRRNAKELGEEVNAALGYVMEHRVEILIPDAENARTLDMDKQLEEHLAAKEQQARDEFRDTSRDRNDQVGPYNFIDRSQELANKSAEIDMDATLKANTALPKELAAEMITDIAAMSPDCPSAQVLRRVAETRDFSVQNALLRRGLALDVLADSEHEQIVAGVATKLGLSRNAERKAIKAAAAKWAQSNRNRTINGYTSLSDAETEQGFTLVKAEKPARINCTLAQARSARDELRKGNVTPERHARLEAMMAQFPNHILNKHYSNTKAGDLERAIDEARDFLKHAIVSDDGGGIPKGQQWVTNEKKTQIEALLATAPRELARLKFIEQTRYKKAVATVKAKPKTSQQQKKPKLSGINH